MSVELQHSAVKHFGLPYNETEVEEWAKSQKQRLPGQATFGLLFTSPDCTDHVKEIIEIVRIYAHVPTMIGCSANGLIANNREIENERGFCIALFHLPNTRAKAVHLPEDCFQVPNRSTALRAAIGPGLEKSNAWLLFGASESIGNEAWLPDWDQATGGRVTVGGFAGADLHASESFLFHDNKIYSEGAVALALQGAVTIEPLVSQGCRPIGSPWTITQAENNIIHKIGNRPILEVLRDTLQGMTRQEQKQARGNIFIGLVFDEYKPSFETGDFLVRNLAAIDPKTGAVAIATPLRVGQNLQFQIRDAQAASTDFEALLDHKAAELATRPVYGACLCDCIGRGSSLYGVPDHDARMVRHIFPNLPLVGLFCDGEFGPNNKRTLLHGYAASLALFVQAAKPEE